VISMRRAQLSFGDGLIAVEVEDLLEEWMKHAEEVLNDEQLVATVFEALAKRRPKSRSRGRQARGRFKIRVKSGHRAGGKACSGALGDRPDHAAAGFAGDLFLNLTDAEVGRGGEMVSISLTVHGATGGRPRCFSPSLSCLHAGSDPLANRRRFELWW
jgi:hypothetical protein